MKTYCAVRRGERRVSCLQQSRVSTVLARTVSTRLQDDRLCGILYGAEGIDAAVTVSKRVGIWRHVARVSETL